MARAYATLAAKQAGRHARCGPVVAAKTLFLLRPAHLRTVRQRDPGGSRLRRLGCWVPTVPGGDQTTCEDAVGRRGGVGFRTSAAGRA